MAKNDTAPLTPKPVEGSSNPEPRHFHPGHQTPVHTSVGGTQHTHPHMGFSEPSGDTASAGNVNHGDASASGKHVIPVGKFKGA